MTRAAVLEGCVNETLAALEAQAAAAAAEPEAVRTALHAIEQQESEHASLAFAFVAWATTVDRAARPAAREAFELAKRACEQPTSAPDAQPAALLARHGRLSASQRNQLRRQAFPEVVAPALRELLAG